MERLPSHCGEVHGDEEDGDGIDALERIKSRLKTVEALAEATISSMEGSPMMGDREGTRAYLLANEIKDAVGSLLHEVHGLVARALLAAAERSGSAS